MRVSGSRALKDDGEIERKERGRRFFTVIFFTICTSRGHGGKMKCPKVEIFTFLFLSAVKFTNGGVEFSP